MVELTLILLKRAIEVIFRVNNEILVITLFYRVSTKYIETSHSLTILDWYLGKTLGFILN